MGSLRRARFLVLGVVLTIGFVPFLGFLGLGFLGISIGTVLLIRGFAFWGTGWLVSREL